ncbi:MAG: ABC transporter permease [Gemmatimonadota bacterium]|nr:MAG: ABC transporter permease [Gemmatimonadota bacterium]
MIAFEIVMVALGAIRANALRSILTTLGVVIGISAVIAMVSLGEGAQRSVADQIDRMGTNVLTIRANQRHFGGVVTDATEDLTVDDAEALRDASGGLLTIVPQIASRTQLAYLRWNSNNQVVGTWTEYFDIYNHQLVMGRFFTPGENQGRRRVAVLGYEIPEALGTPTELLVGATIQIRGQPFKVIGVLAEKGDSRGFNPDNQVFIPIATAQYRLFGGRRRLSSILALVNDGRRMDQAFADIDRELRRQHKITPGADVDFTVRNSADLLQTANEATATFTLLLAGIAAISLLVGGIGIMNIMLVSVTERTREIGVRKALGATGNAIMLQFLVEATVLCGMGGILGVAVGVGGSRAMTRIANWETAISGDAILVALGFSIAIGLFFGIWPARRAARLNPIDALRYE